MIDALPDPVRARESGMGWTFWFWTAEVIGAVGAAIGVLPACAQTDLEAARKQYVSACAVCHASEPGGPPRQGPHLAGVIGRMAGTLPGYKFSPALTGAGFVWTGETLDAWLTDAQIFRPGTTMLYRQPNPERRQLVIEYLKSLNAGAEAPK